MTLLSELEIWKKHPTLDWLEVSSFGRFLIESYDIQMPNGGIKHIIPKPTYGWKMSKNNGNYKCYRFVNKKRNFSKYAHTLICETFHGSRASDKSVVMHLDDNPLNNCINNLKWGTQKENLNTESFIKYCKSRVGKENPHIKGKLLNI